MKLTKAERKAHNQAVEILNKDVLTETEKEFVLQNWHPGAVADIGAAGAFFTPFDLAKDFRIEVGGGRIIDLCAGIGALAYWLWNFPWGSDQPIEIVCVENNPAFVEVGKKIVPEATWICGNVFDVLEMNLGHFDWAVANPPFGRVNRHGRRANHYQGSDFAYHVIDLASEIADFGAFILSAGSAPFRYSGAPYYQRRESADYVKFQEATGVYLEAGAGIDTSIFANDWKGTRIGVEIVTTDFIDARDARAPRQGDLFAVAA